MQLQVLATPNCGFRLRILFGNSHSWHRRDQSEGDVWVNNHLSRRIENITVNLIRLIMDGLAGSRQKESDTRLKISNLTRDAELASCVEVANHGAQRRKGLLGRKTLSPGEGLWIVPCEAVHTFGMKFRIDLVYLDRNKRVKKVRNEVPPWRLSGCLLAHSVLELAEGTVRRTQTRPGDRLEFSSADPLSDGGGPVGLS